MDKMTLEDVEVKGKKVLMRVDFNVPIEDGEIGDDNRIMQALRSINYVTENGGKLILMSHLGRPGGEFDESLSLKPVAEHLQTLVDTKVHFAEDCIGDEATSVIEKAEDGEIVLLENVRFHKGEKANDEDFCKQLAGHGDLFCNDAFGSSHRAHSSVAGITRFLQPAVSGYLLEKEIKYLNDSVNDPEHPFVAILGGAKVSDKITLLKRLMKPVDHLLIGGGMAYTFFKAQGAEVGKSLVEEKRIEIAKELLEQAEAQNTNLLLPEDSVIATEVSPDSETTTASNQGIPQNYRGLDIGPKAAEAFTEVIANSKKILWNGPMGVFEYPNFEKGTRQVGEAVAQSTTNNAFSLAGGGDTLAALTKFGLEDKLSFISTGGGALLTYIEGGKLPGLSAISE
jgi:phosphoglycerate kinase